MEFEDRIYELMMEALDGTISASEQSELESHLRAHPSYMAEWQAMQAIDTLFRQTPALSPAADFAQRTMARLPNRRVRIWVLSAIYFSLLVSGTLPILLGIWVFNQLGEVLVQPALLQTVLQLVNTGIAIAVAVFGAAMDVATEFVVQQPAVLGWLLVLGGMVSLWGGVYRQLLGQSSQQITS